MAQPSLSTKPRSATIDHIRIVLTLLVILHHVAIVYGGSGGWYWKQEPDSSNLFLVLFNAINQAYFMGFFFLLAGYYTPLSVERKGAAHFMKDRLIRLGIPLVVYFFLIQPFVIALTLTTQDTALWSQWWDRIVSADFGPGPLWFTQTLLLFAIGFLVWNKIKPLRGKAATFPSFLTLILSAILLGICSFFLRLFIPVGEDFLWMQLGYFPCYIFLFIAGCLAAKNRLLDKIEFSRAFPWSILSFFALLSLPIIVLFRLEQGGFEGGWNLNALYYALWDPFVAWGVILGMLWLFQRYFSKPFPFTTWLSQNAYGAYILHPIFIVWLSLLGANWAMQPMVKFAIVGIASCSASFISASLLRTIPGVKKVV